MWGWVPGEGLDPLLGSLRIEIVCSGPVFRTFLLPFASWKTCGERRIGPRWRLLGPFFSLGILFWACLKYPGIYVLLHRNCKSSCPNFNWLPIFQAHISLLFKNRSSSFIMLFLKSQSRWPSFEYWFFSPRRFEAWGVENFYQTRFAADSCVHISPQTPFL